MKRLALSLALCAALGCSGGGEDATDAAGGAMESAGGAADDMLASASEHMASMAGDIEGAGLMKLAEMKTKLGEKTMGILQGITNVETAEQALPNLKDVAANIGAMKDRLHTLGGSLGDVPGETKTAFQAQMSRLDGMPAVKQVIAAPLATIAGFFGA